MKLHLPLFRTVFVYYLNHQLTTLKHIGKGVGPQHLNTDVISNVIQDDKDRIWIAPVSAAQKGGIILTVPAYGVVYLVADGSE